MSANRNIGYGWSPEALEAQWEELTTPTNIVSGPSTPKCLKTRDLDDLALGMPMMDLTMERYRKHLADCLDCRERHEIVERHWAGVRVEVDRLIAEATANKSTLRDTYENFWSKRKDKGDDLPEPDVRI